MVNDPIADMLIQIKNAGLAKRSAIDLPFSRMKFEVAKILVKEGFINTAEKTGIAPRTRLSITLKYLDDKSVMTDVKRISKPGLRWYVDKKNLPRVLGGMGIAIISTSRGIMTDREARKMGVGGEVLCHIW